MVIAVAKAMECTIPVNRVSWRFFGDVGFLIIVVSIFMNVGFS